MNSTIDRFNRTLLTVEDFNALVLTEKRFVTENGHQTEVKYIKVDKEDFLFQYGFRMIPQLADNRRITIESVTPEIMTEYEAEIGQEGRIDLLKYI